MSDRATILDAVRRACTSERAHPGPYPVPSGSAAWPDFAASLRAAGGEAHGPVPRPALAQTVAALCETSGEGAVRIDPALAPLLGEGPWSRAGRDDRVDVPAETDVFVAPGCVGVAENGAVGVVLPGGPRAASVFLCQHLILVLERKSLEPDMHRGLERLAAKDVSLRRCVWIAGPSKTADIEQTLVLGAHGPRTLAVVAVSDS